MKTLTLLRHAKSGWDDPVARDFDRPLNPKGERAAALMGQHLRGEGLAFDHILASPAVRVVQTLDQLQAGYGRTLAPAFDPRIYLASATTLLDLVRELPEGADQVLMVGHNPGLEELVLLLAEAVDTPLRAAAEAKYPTATLAQLRLPAARWQEAAPGSAELVRFVRPRDLDPTLGPGRD